MKITLEDHSDEVLEALESACQRALEKCGLVGEGYAKKLCPVTRATFAIALHILSATAKRLHISAQIASMLFMWSAALAYIIPVVDKHRGRIKTKTAIGI